MTAGFGDLSHRLDLLTREMSGKAQADRLKRVGELSTRDIDSAVRADLGDMSMSGWRRNNKIEITSRYSVHKSGSAVTMSPTRYAVGPMRVRERGRNQGDAGGMAGPGVSADGTTSRTKAGGVRKVANRSKLVVGDGRVRRRWNGTTDGKGTWTDATKIMERKMPGRYEVQLARDIARHIRGS